MPSSYLLIESRDPFEWSEVPSHYELARDLARDGNTVTLFLVQNGVLAARKNARSGALEALAKDGVEVLADEFSLRERGIAAVRLAGATPAPLDRVLEALEEGRKTLWL